jgi:hypothetical protein
VLDAILDNEAELLLVEHTTDTAGYTEIVFAFATGCPSCSSNATWSPSHPLCSS